MNDKRAKRIEAVLEVGAYAVIFGVVTLFVMGVIVLGSVALR